MHCPAQCVKTNGNQEISMPPQYFFSSCRKGDNAYGSGLIQRVKIMFNKIISGMFAALLLVLSAAMARAADAPPSPIEQMQSQVMELQEKIRALREIQKKEGPDLTQVENQRRYSRMAATESPPMAISMRDMARSAPPRERDRVFDFYGGATTWAQYRANNEFIQSPGLKTSNDGLDAGYSSDFILQTHLGKDHTFTIHAESGEGQGPNHALGFFNSATGAFGGLGSNPNYDALHVSRQLQINEAFYEGRFFSRKLLLTLGKIEPHAMYDQNAFAGDETTQFLSNIFVRSTGVTFRELDNYYGPGLRVMVTPVPSFEISLVLANSNFDNVDNNGLAAFQINFTPSGMRNKGNYRFFWVFDDRSFTSLGGVGTDNNIGWGFSLDQKFSDWLGGFFRYSSVEDDLRENVVSGSWSLGAEISGISWHRPEDVLSMAWGVAQINNRVPGLGGLKDEKHFEAYYRYSINDYIALSPDIQVIINQPRIDASTLAIFGVRGQFDFRL